MKKRVVSVLCAIAMVAGMLTGCGGSDSGKKADGSTATSGTEGGTFVQAINSMPSSFIPDPTNDDQTSVVHPVLDRLFSETAGEKEYYLADSVEVSEDGKTYTIHLNEKANWSDGEPITVDDVLFAIDYNSVYGGGASEYNTINGEPITFNKKDDKTLEIVLPQVFNRYMATLATICPMPSHIFDGDATKVDDSGYFYSTDMVTSGAFTISELNSDSIVFKARDDYYRGTPSIKTLVLKTTGAGSTRQVALDNGEISYMRVTTNEELEKYENDDNYNVYSVPEARLNYFEINNNGPANLTLEQRKAIFMALNQEEILDAAYGNDKLVTAANSVFTPDQAFWSKDLKGYSQNVEEAKKIAEETGLTEKTLIYIYNADRPNMEAIATTIQQQLAAIGVKLSIEGLESSSFFQRFFAVMLFQNGQENTWDLGTNGWDSMRGTNLCQGYQYFTNEKAWGFSQDVADAAIKVNETANLDEAKEAAVDLHNKVMAEYWQYPLTYTNYVMISKKNVTGLDGSQVVPEFNDYLSINVE